MLHCVFITSAPLARMHACQSILLPQQQTLGSPWLLAVWISGTPYSWQLSGHALSVNPSGGVFKIFSRYQMSKLSKPKTFMLTPCPGKSTHTLDKVGGSSQWNWNRQVEKKNAATSEPVSGAQWCWYHIVWMEYCQLAKVLPQRHYTSQNVRVQMKGSIHSFRNKYDHD